MLARPLKFSVRACVRAQAQAETAVSTTPIPLLRRVVSDSEEKRFFICEEKLTRAKNLCCSEVHLGSRTLPLSSGANESSGGRFVRYLKSPN